jgi:hypothetical protein
MRIQSTLILTITFAAFAACGGGDDGDGSSFSANCQGLKDYTASCRTEFPNLVFDTDTEVQEVCDLIVLSAGCISAQFTAGCEELASDDSSTPVLNACFPSCTDGDPNTCSGNAITVCTDPDDTGDFRSLIFNCGPFCELDASSYVGTCSDMYMDQTSDSGEDVCWCGA